VQLIWIASLFFAVVIALFAVQNTTPVPINFLVWRLEAVAASALVLAAAALAALLTYLLGLGREIRHRRALRAERATIREQEALIADLRARVSDLEQQVGGRELGVGSRGPESTEPAPSADSRASDLAPPRPAQSLD